MFQCEFETYNLAINNIDLSVQSKSIYSYFCSYAGSGNSTFPSRNKIMQDLKIGKDKYYNHYKPLIQNGYINVKQGIYKDKKTGQIRKGNNIYTLITNPKKYVENQEKTNNHKTKASPRIRNNGMKSGGYGIVPKAVVLDSRLSIEAKGVYAYFCSYAGSGNSAFPKVTDILYHLQISEKSYYKYYNELVTLNYISTVQRINEKGQKECNDYYLNETPNMELVEKTPTSKKPDTQKPDTQKPDTQNPDTFIINSITTNSINNKQSINQTKKNKKDRLSKNQLIKMIKKEIIKYNEIPYHYTQDNRKMELTIQIVTNYDEYFAWYEKNKNDDLKVDHVYASIFKLFNEALIEMLTSKKMTLKGSCVTYAKVYDRLHKNIEITTSTYTHEDILNIDDIMNNAISDYRKASEKLKIQNPLAYMKSIIWNVLQVGNVSLITDINREWGM